MGYRHGNRAGTVTTLTSPFHVRWPYRLCSATVLCVVNDWPKSALNKAAPWTGTQPAHVTLAAMQMAEGRDGACLSRPSRRGSPAVRAPPGGVAVVAHRGHICKTERAAAPSQGPAPLPSRQCSVVVAVTNTGRIAKPQQLSGAAGPRAPPPRPPAPSDAGLGRARAARVRPALVLDLFAVRWK